MWKTLKPEELKDNVFELIGKEWMLVGAGDENGANAMTASWGGLGVLWGKPVAYVFIRPQRFTKTIVDEKEKMSLSFFAEDCRKMLNYMGKASGRDEDKIRTAGLTADFAEGVPVFEESRMTLVCRKLFVQELSAKSFLEKDILPRWYPGNDLHTMYVVEIEKVLLK